MQEMRFEDCLPILQEHSDKPLAIYKNLLYVFAEDSNLIYDHEENNLHYYRDQKGKIYCLAKKLKDNSGKTITYLTKYGVRKVIDYRQNLRVKYNPM